MKQMADTLTIVCFIAYMEGLALLWVLAAWQPS